MNEQQANPVVTKMIAGIALVAVIGVGGFVGGMQYEKGHTTATTTTASTSTRAAGNFRGGMQNGSFGSVTAVSDTSISVEDRRSTTAKTYTIDSSTAITNDGSTVAASSITVGERVMVQTASSTSTTATSINVNPTMGGGQPGAAGTTMQTN